MKLGKATYPKSMYICVYIFLTSELLHIRSQQNMMSLSQPREYKILDEYYDSFRNYFLTSHQIGITTFLRCREISRYF